MLMELWLNIRYLVTFNKSYTTLILESAVLLDVSGLLCFFVGWFTPPFKAWVIACFMMASLSFCWKYLTHKLVSFMSRPAFDSAISFSWRYPFLAFYWMYIFLTFSWRYTFLVFLSEVSHRQIVHLSGFENVHKQDLTTFSSGCSYLVEEWSCHRNGHVVSPVSEDGSSASARLGRGG